MSAVRFVRRGDGLSYEFVRDGEAHGFPAYRRVDLGIWCLRMPDFGWAVCARDGTVSSRPFDDPGQGELPPEGAWVSRKGDRSYVYDLSRVDAPAVTGHE
ncbi:hypothetical protein F5X71_17795 [Nocardia brasiliensis]|uniref:Uncharacterized protein n=1 Tax=Nocardia brasiliensis TaxID=37326 RepID=A0A6G9XSP1_NOCBR|nr:hypothetical protein [Nocardia brasiliensis]QIS03929.1 hypothetical protein F5X71_17795 [Nocardia brasiliensis]